MHPPWASGVIDLCFVGYFLLHRRSHSRGALRVDIGAPHLDFLGGQRLTVSYAYPTCMGKQRPLHRPETHHRRHTALFVMDESMPALSTPPSEAIHFGFIGRDPIRRLGDSAAPRTRSISDEQRLGSISNTMRRYPSPRLSCLLAFAKIHTSNLIQLAR